MNDNKFIKDVELLYKEVPVNELVERLGVRLSECGYKSFNEKLDICTKVTKSTKSAAFSWFNNSRGIRIPLVKLCMLCEFLNVDVLEILGGKDMERKFCILSVKGNEEKVLEILGNEKDEAIKKGKEISEKKILVQQL